MTISAYTGPASSATVWIAIGNIADSILRLVPDACGLVGLVLVMHALVKATRVGQSGGRDSWGGVIGEIYFGAMLSSIAMSMAMVSHSFFGPTFNGYGSVSPISTGVPMAQAVQEALTNLIVLLGWFAFIRGLYVWRSVADGGGQDRHPFWTGLTFVVAGALAANIGATLASLTASFL
ncbi:hypothetical protein [Acidiferrobacter thiooxydans]|uniref:Uncharacterized protein n=1 Tax=Acidiferrobacter thiooxydans TaxID=163359 RepID=A0A1C2FWT6_9GAMM|nr:hypothetical protein [Acidiferrobacter thiooxydans]RCN55810.1 hypothetical protein C4900_07775 [Acidiferrobacter thiooxydans]UEN98400.1 hypothetical protein A9R16_008060 [Acidiferrobacter thiooxydans]